MKPPRHSFAYDSEFRFFGKLADEYESFVADPLSSRHAINFAMTAWHIAEWAWAQHLKDNPKEQSELYGTTFKDLKSYRSHLVSACPDLKIVQAICNGSKHVDTVSRITRTFKKTPFRKGAKKFLGVEIDGQEQDFADIATRVYRFWKSKIMPKYAKAFEEFRKPRRTQKPFAPRDPNEPIEF